MSLVNLNKRNLWICESRINSPNGDDTVFSDISNVYKPVNIQVSLTSSEPKYVKCDGGTPSNTIASKFNTSFICPYTDGTNAITITDTSCTKITFYTSYNSGSPVTVYGGDGTANNGNGNLFTIFEVYDYIINKLDAFNNAMTYVQRCDEYTKLSKSMNSNPRQLIKGRGNYSNNDTSCGMFRSLAYATLVTQPPNAGGSSGGSNYFDTYANVFSSSLYNNSGAYDYLKGIPAWASNVVQKPDLNTQPYIDITKSLMQQLADLINLTNNYQTILEKYKGTTGSINYVNGPGNMHLYLNNTFTGSYNFFSLTDLSKQVDILRNELDNHVSEILADQSTSLYQSQLLKDSSVYANVMWTILATSLIYYVFVKL